MMKSLVRLANFRGRRALSLAPKQEEQTLNISIKAPNPPRSGKRLGVCAATGQTYAQKYDCSLLEGATVLNEANGFGLSLPNVDLREAGQWTADDVAAVRAAIQDGRGVLTFPGQEQLRPEEHLALAAAFGEVETHLVAKGLPGFPQILEIQRERGAEIIFGEEWHSDHSFQPLPASFSFLRATAEVTPYGTNNTEFAHTEAAWEALSPAMQRLLLPLNAFHSAGKAYGDGRKYGKTTPNSKEAMAQTSSMDFAVETEEDIIPDVIHPVVVRHPETGRDAIFISETFTNGIVGMTRDEGRELTMLIQNHVTRPEFRLEVAYEPGQLTMWDNRQLIHRGLCDDNSARRVIHRASVSMGVPPKATRDFL